MRVQSAGDFGPFASVQISDMLLEDLDSDTYWYRPSFFEGGSTLFTVTVIIVILNWYHNAFVVVFFYIFSPE